MARKHESRIVRTGAEYQHHNDAVMRRADAYFKDREAQGIEYRAQKALPVDGKPSWYGQYRPAPRAPWRTAASDYGMIRYETPEAAVAGAKVYAEQCEASEPR